MPNPKRFRSEIIGDVARLAAKRENVSMHEISKRICKEHGLSSVYRTAEQLHTGEIGFEKFLTLAKWAGIPVSYACVLWAKAHIPDSHEQYRKYVGITLRPPRRRDYFPRPGRERVKPVEPDFLMALKLWLRSKLTFYQAVAMPDKVSEYAKLSGQVRGVAKPRKAGEKNYGWREHAKHGLFPQQIEDQERMKQQKAADQEP